MRVEVNNHVCGIFPLSVWHRALKTAGFDKDYQEKFKATKPNNADFDVLVAVKPE